MEENTHIQTETSDSTENLHSRLNKMKNQEFFGPNVQKIGDCAVVTIEDEVVTFELPITYTQLLSCLIKRKYSYDDAEAITANFLITRTQDISEAKASEYIAEYEKYQEWRNKAKIVAKEIMGISED